MILAYVIGVSFVFSAGFLAGSLWCSWFTAGNTRYYVRHPDRMPSRALEALLKDIEKGA